MPIYHADVPDHLDEAVDSIINQTLSPDEIILVKDGPIGEELDVVIEKWIKLRPGLFQVFALPENKGLGPALQAGLEKCSYDIVARMDADDISCPDRFEKQLTFLQKNPDVSLVSSWMACFEKRSDNITFVRRAPITHERISKLARFRNPINHAASVFRRSAVMEVGGYRHWPGFEDYHLYVRMLLNGAKMACIPEVLYRVRQEGLYSRRRGLRRICLTVRLQKEFLKMGFISYLRFFLNITVRTIACVLPITVVRLIRTKLLKF